MSNMKKKNGFTLIELLATIAVLSVVITLVIYFNIKLMDNSRNKSYQVTINNVEKVASNYILENVGSKDWVDSNDGDYQYQCITVQDLIDAGYFKNDVLDSMISKEEYLNADDSVYIERDTLSKTVTKNVLLVGNADDYSELCNQIKHDGNINIVVKPSVWSDNKVITIKYKLSNFNNISNYKYSYSYKLGDGSTSKSVNSKFTNASRIETFTVNENGTLFAKILDGDGNEVVSKTFIVNKIDNGVPIVSVSSTNEIASTQTVTLSMSDNGAGIKSYYIGKDNPELMDVEWKDVVSEDGGLQSLMVTQSVDTNGTWYFGAIDGSGNKTVVNKDFYLTSLLIDNAVVEPNVIMTMEGNELSFPNVNVDLGYEFKGWYKTENYSGSVITKYIPTSDSILYGKTESKLYTVMLDGNGATTKGTESVQVTYSNAMPNIKIPTRIGYVFNGYYSTKAAIDMSYSSSTLTNSSWRVDFLKSNNGWLKTTEDVGTHIQIVMILNDSTISSIPTLEFNDVVLVKETDYRVSVGDGSWIYYIDFDITEKMVSARSHNYDTKYRFIDINGLSSNGSISIMLATKNGKKYYSNKGTSVWNYDIYGNTTLYANWIDVKPPTAPTIITMYDVYGSRTKLLNHMTQNGNFYTTTGNDPYINFANIDVITGINGAYIGLSSGAPANTSFQVFYETSGVSLNEKHSNRDTLAKDGKQLYIPFTNSGTWVKARYDFGSTKDLKFAVSNLAVSAKANQWNRDDIILMLSTTEEGSGVAYWQYTFADNASSTGTDDTTSWVTYDNSNNLTFISSAFTEERNQLVYVRACDNAGNCSDKKSTYIKIDKTLPIASIGTTSTLKSTSQKATLKCSDDVNIAAYYWGTSSSAGTYVTNTTDLNKLKGTGLTKTVSSADTYYLFCKDTAGNVSSTSKTYYSYEVNNMLDTVSGKQGTYTTANYEQKSSSTYFAPEGTSLTLESIYTAPATIDKEVTFVGGSTGKASTTAASVSSNAPTLKSDSTYSIWFNRKSYTLTLDKGTGISSVSGAGSKKWGASVSIDATPSTGYSWKNWTGYSTTSTKNHIFTMPAKDVTYKANATANKYTLTYNSGNLLYGLEDIDETTSSYMKYKVSDGKVTVTATGDDGYGYTNGRVYLEAGKTYIFNATTDGTWGGGSGTKTVEAYLMLNGSTTKIDNVSPYTWLSSNINKTFTVPFTGTYWLRFDVNKSGQTNTFSNISITTDLSSSTVTYNSAYGTLKSSTKTGYVFSGWYTAVSGGNKVTNTTIVNTAGNHKLYAQWTPYTYNIRYSLNDGILGSNAPISATYDKRVNVTNPTKIVTVTGNANGTGAIIGNSTSASQTFAGWTFNGKTSTAKYGTIASMDTAWSSTSTKVTASYFRNLTTTNGGTVTMTANWTPQSIILPTVSKPGYTCKWYTKASSGTEMGASGASWTPSATSLSAVTAYARCTANKYTVTLNNQGATTAGSTSVTATYNSAMPKIISPAKDGWVFKGYYSNTSAFDMTYKVTGSSNKRIDLLDDQNGWTMTTKGDSGKHIQGKITLVDSSISSTPIIQFSDLTLTNGTHYKVTSSSGTYTYYLDFDISDSMVSLRGKYDYEKQYRFIDIEGISSNATLTVDLLVIGGKKYYSNKGTSVWNYDVDGNTTLYAKWVDEAGPAKPSIITMYDIYGSRTKSLNHMTQNENSYTTTGNDPYINFANIDGIKGINGAYIGLSSGAPANTSFQVFYETLNAGLNEAHSNSATLLKDGKQLYIPFTNSGTWVKARYDFGGTKDLKFNVSNLAVSANAGQWNRDDIILRLSTTEKGSGVAYWQYTFADNASSTGTDDTTSWVTYNGSNSSIFIPSAFTVARNQLVYVRACDNSGNCSDKNSTYIKIDKTAPLVSDITGGTSLNVTSQNLTLKCSDTVGVTGYYWGTTEPTSAESMTIKTSSDLTSLAGNGLTKTVNKDGTYWLGCRDAAGNYNKKSIVIRKYMVNNLLETIAGETGKYTSTNYTSVSDGTFYVKDGTTLTLSSIYTVPKEAITNSFKGHSTGYSSTVSSLSTTNPKVSTNDTTYYMWFNRTTHTLSLNIGEGINSVSGAGKYKYGKSVAIKATLKDGYLFSNWAVNSGNTPSNVSSTSTNVTITQNTSLTANTTKNSYTIKIKVGNGISKVALSGWTNTGTGTMTKSLAYGSVLDLSTITPTYKSGYKDVVYAKTSGSGTLSGSKFTVGASAATITLSAKTLLAPNPSISTGNVNKIYGSSSTTLSATQTTNYGGNSAIKIYYKFGSSTSSTGTYSYGSASTGTTSTITKTSHYGIKYYKVQAYVTDGTLTSSTATWSGSMSVTLRGTKMTLNANSCGTIGSGTNPFYAKYGTTDIYSTETDTTAAKIPSFTVKEGYKFNGWYTEASGGSKLMNANGTIAGSVADYASSSGWLATTDKTLYAQCSKSSYKITYMLGSSTITSSTITYGSTVTLKTWANLGKTFSNSSNGWSFAGWSTSSTGTTSNYSNGQKFTYNMTDNLTLYAIGSRTFRFYSGIAPTKVLSSDTQYWNPSSTSSITSITVPEPVKIAGWTFLEYRATDDANSTVILDKIGINTPVYNNLTAFDFMSKYSRTLSISYDGNESTSGTTKGSTAIQYYSSGIANNGSNSSSTLSTATFTLAANGFSKTGYSFSKWADESTSGTQYATGAKYTWSPSVDIQSPTKTMYAIWDPNSYSIDYELDGGIAGEYAPTSGVFGTAVIIAHPIKTYSVNIENSAAGTLSSTATITGSYVFDGWTYSNGDTNTAQFISKVDEQTFDWSSSTTKVKEGTFLNLRSTSGTVTMTANWGAASLTLPTVTKVGYTCGFTETDGGITIDYVSGGTYPINVSTLYTVCIANEYSIAYKLSDNEEIAESIKMGSNAPTSATFGKDVTISEPTRVGYSFAGWTYSNGDTSTAKYYVPSDTAPTSWASNTTMVKATKFLDLRSSAGTVTMNANFIDDIPPTGKLSITDSNVTLTSNNGTLVGTNVTLKFDNILEEGSGIDKYVYNIIDASATCTGGNPYSEPKYIVTSLSPGKYKACGWIIDKAENWSDTYELSFTLVSSNTGIPLFIYNGQNYCDSNMCTIVNDSDQKIDDPSSWDGDWKVRFTEGNDTALEFIEAPEGIDIFVVGGGGAGAEGAAIYRAQQSLGASGGGGGSSVTVIGFEPSVSTTYNLTIGTGGTTSSNASNSLFKVGDETCYTGNAGSNGNSPYFNGYSWQTTVAGAGGAAGTYSSTGVCAAKSFKDSTGSNGGRPYQNDTDKETLVHYGKIGTIEFNGSSETGNIYYGAGGGSGGFGASQGSGGLHLGATGGTTGGGLGGQGCSVVSSCQNGSKQVATGFGSMVMCDAINGGAADANTGSGGGGGGGTCGSGNQEYKSYYNSFGGNGASGIIIIRNTRGAAPKYNVTYDFNHNYSYSSDEYLDTGYKLNYNENFTIESTFKITSTGKRYLVFGNYSSGVVTNLNVEVTTGNKLRVYMGNAAVDTSVGTVVANEDITVKFNWDASKKTYSVTATGASTNISTSGTYIVSGNATNSLRIGTMDNRGFSVFNPITISKFKITKPHTYETTLNDLPTSVASGFKFNGFYTSTSGGSKVTTSTIMNSKSAVTYYANWDAYKVTIKYSVNGGVVASSTSDSTYTYSWSSDSSDVVYYSKNGGTSSLFKHTVNHGSTLGSNGLANWDNSNGLYITKTGYYAVNGSEWVCLSGDCTVDKIYNDSTAYAASDFCDTSSGNCTVVLGVNWKEDNEIPTCTLSADSSGVITATSADTGGSGLAYYGWDSSFTGSNSTTLTINSEGVPTYYVKDIAGNVGSCSLMVTKMRKECDVVEYNGKCLQWINGNNVEYPWSYRCDEGYYKLNSSWCWQPGFEMKNMKGTQRFYENGTHWELGYVGLYTPTSSNRVVRYSFTTGSDFTASSVRVWFRPWGLNEGVADNLRFHITKDSESHKNANSSSVYSGVLSQTSPEFRDKPLLVGNANVSLEPNSTYYLYVYGVKTHGWWNWDFADYDSVALITFLTK